MSVQSNNQANDLAYDRIAQVYLEMAGNVESQQRAKRRIDWLASQVEGPVVLDIGCSEGILPILLGRKGISVTGIDINPKSIQFANDLLSKEPNEVQQNIDFICSDSLQYQFTSQHYNTVILGEVIEHLFFPNFIINKAIEALIPDGTILITTPFGYFPDPDHHQTFTLRTFIALISDRLTPVSLSVVDGYIRFVGKNTIPLQNAWDKYKNENILDLTEQAALREQKRYRKIVDDQQNEIRRLQQIAKKINLLEEQLTDKDNELQKIKTFQSQLEKEEETLKKDFQLSIKDFEEINNKYAQSIHSLEEKEKLLEQLTSEKMQLQIEKEKLLEQLTFEKMQLQEEQNKNKTEIEKIKKQLSSTTSEYKKSHEQLIYYMDQFNIYHDAYVDMENSVAYQIGNLLKLAVIKPGKNTLLLPVKFLKLFKRGLNRISKRKQNQAAYPENRQKTNLGTQKKQLSPQKLQNKKKNKNFILDYEIKNLKSLRIASIMDPFTFQSFDPECVLSQLSPDHWKDEIDLFKPHLVFIESAWQGKDNLWYRQVDKLSNQVLNLIIYCDEKNIPTIFWNKEDPVHFETFINTAVLCDVIFTTDIDSIPKYKAITGNDKVFLMPFAAQTKIHNPIEKFSRKDRFNFAGAYYAHFPERTKDLNIVFEAVKSEWDLDIYDRNSYPDNPNYRFPEIFKKHILGTLPPEEIDIAYKGYKYGINLNTIKQSQTMFARRVFELLASNTVTVSNYSRGVRNFFGDLVICSDNKDQLIEGIKLIESDPLYYKKFRLAGLRKVLSQDTYQDRLDYLVQKVFNTKIKKDLPSIHAVSFVNTQQELQKSINNFQNQYYHNVRYTIIHPYDLFYESSFTELKTIELIPLSGLEEKTWDQISDADYITIFYPQDYYGKNYLYDLALTTKYTQANYIGKSSYFESDQNNQIMQKNINAVYCFSNAFDKRACMIQLGEIASQNVLDFLSKDEPLQISSANGFSVDEFNYCRNVDDENLDLVQDIEFPDRGIETNRLLNLAEVIKKEENSGPTIKGDDLLSIFPRVRMDNIQINYLNQNINISSSLPDDKHEYIYSEELISISDIDLGCNQAFRFPAKGNCDIQLVVFWLDKNKNKISADMVLKMKTTNVCIPKGTNYVRFGLRIKGSGHASFDRIEIKNEHNLKTKPWIGKSDTLLITNIYPQYDNLYRNGFVHRRVAAYKKENYPVDVMTISPHTTEGFYEFEGIDVISGNAFLLESALSTGQYKKVLIHFLDQTMWQVIKNYLSKVKVFIWLHGSEVQPWWRREYNLDNDEEKHKAIYQSTLREELWRDVFKSDQTNLHLIFVSNYFANEVAEDYKIDLSTLNYSIIHNLIDENIFRYEEKDNKQRKRILSIRSFSSQKYGNDLSINTILDLSKKDFFKELEFRIIGDGILFNEVTKPVNQFSNITLEKKFITQKEIATLQKEYGMFLNPTRWDSQGVSRDEAMLSGLVPLTNNVAAIPEFVDESCAILAKEESYQEFVEGIEKIYYDPDLFQKMSKAAAQRVKAQSSYKKTIYKELNLIKKQGTINGI
ncbi:MAG: methyltransferase type 12 [Anaerolineaceae bacterium]|nr:methyltransferase type 12 [Anaerolineaceae bacterium]